MEDSDVNVIYVSCAARDDRGGPPYEWVDTNFWSIFDETKYDIIQTGRSGYREFPFDRMHKSIFVDSIHGSGDTGIEKRENILATVLLSKTHVDGWIGNGGEKHKINIISPLVEMPPKTQSSPRHQLQIDSQTFVYGMHQGTRDDIYSPTPLEAYSLIENEDTMFLLLGGSPQYRNQADQLNLQNIKFLDFTGDTNKIHEFISTLDVFAHGRSDGEVCSAAIIEALYHGKPVISHPALNMGHLEQISECGFLAKSISEYANCMVALLKNKSLYDILSERALEKYTTTYSLETNINKYIRLYRKIVNGKQI